MMRKVALLLVVLVIAAQFVFAVDHEMDLEQELDHELELEHAAENELELSELAEHAAQFDPSIAKQFISNDEDDESEDFDDLASQEREEREAKEEERRKREKIRRIRAERRAKARLARARGPIYNAGLNITDAANATSADGAKKKKGKSHFNRKHLDAKEKEMLAEARRFESIARTERARAKAHAATVDALRAIHQENKLQAKIARDNGKITYELQSAMDAINTVKNDMERDDLDDDTLFWDAFYGKKAHNNVTTPTQPEIIIKQSEQAAQGKKALVQKKDMAIPLYKAAHIASFEEAYGRSKKMKKLDDSLREDGDKYLSYVALFN